VPLEIAERLTLFRGCGVVNLGEGAGVELPAQLHREVVPDQWIAIAALAQERDGLGHNVIRRQQEVGELLAAVSFEDLVHADVILVFLADVREEKARVEKDHSSAAP
jgi:hypothetical protein